MIFCHHPETGRSAVHCIRLKVERKTLHFILKT
jgi:hypothetical protein